MYTYMKKWSTQIKWLGKSQQEEMNKEIAESQLLPVRSAFQVRRHCQIPEVATFFLLLQNLRALLLRSLHNAHIHIFELNISFEESVTPLSQKFESGRHRMANFCSTQSPSHSYHSADFGKKLISLGTLGRQSPLLNLTPPQPPHPMISM